MRPNVQDISHLAPATAVYSINIKVLAGIPTPINADEAANKSYADSLIAGKTLNFWSAPTLDLSIGSKKLTNVATPTAASDGSTKKYVDDNVSSLLLNIAGINMATIGAPIANVNFNNKKIINLAEPTLLTDGATKNYVDSKVVAGSGAWSVPTSNLSMGG
jgi:predicted methyltransferase